MTSLIALAAAAAMTASAPNDAANAPVFSAEPSTFSAQTFEFDIPEWMAHNVQEPALKGYDPVSYFDEGKPALGRPEIAAVYHGAVFFFETDAHRDAFLADPEHFAPAFGGYDPVGITKGAFEEADPLAWNVVDDRLYLSRDPGAAEQFRTRAPSAIRKAGETWRMVDDHYESPRFFQAHEETAVSCRTYGESGFKLDCKPAGRLLTPF